MAAAAGRFRRADRLLRSGDFRRVSREGKRAASPRFVVLLAEDPASAGCGAGESRLGITASRRVGGAVVRNRIKRRIREWFRLAGERARRGGDLVVIARPGAGNLSSRESWQELTVLVARARSTQRPRVATVQPGEAG